MVVFNLAILKGRKLKITNLNLIRVRLCMLSIQIAKLNSANIKWEPYLQI